MTPDEVTAAMERGDWCSGHCRIEPFDPDAFLTCFECKHQFTTEKELVDAHNAILDELAAGDPTPGLPAHATWAGQVFCCPVCAHDF